MAPTLTVTETATQIHIQMAADILIDFDKSDIRPSVAQALHQAAELIRAQANGAVRIEDIRMSKAAQPATSACSSVAQTL